MTKENTGDNDMLHVTVCVVVYNAIQNIQQCIDSLIAQDYPSSHYEILFIDNNSTDGTKQLLLYYDEHYKNIRTLINPIIGIAGSRNLGLMRAKHDFVAFTDSDCVPPQNWLSRLAFGFENHLREDPELVAVGGSNIPPKNSGLLYDALSVFLNTYLGSHGSVQGKRFDRNRYVSHLPTVNVMYHKPTVMSIGGFDVTFGNIGEDQDLSYRLSKKGCRFIYIADAAVVHKLRPTLKSWLRNMFVYGKGRIWLMRKHTDKMQLMLFAPLLLVLSMPLTILSIWNLIFLVPLFYFPLMLLASIIESIKVRQFHLALPLFFLFIGTHFAYGCGEIAGALKNRERFRLQEGSPLVIDTDK